MVRIAVNGLGRIGRCIIRSLAEQPRDKIEIVAANGRRPIETYIHLLKYDSIHGTFLDIEKKKDNVLRIGKHTITLIQEDNPEKLPWKKLGVDVVFECTGTFRNREEAAKHLQAGAKRVLISAPAEDADITVVYGVNQQNLKSEHTVISVGSCTTNCLAPIVRVLHDAVGIERGFMTTIHSYTNYQKILDKYHKDLRRARAGALSMIPTTTGAAKSIGIVMPELAGRMDGMAIRVPTPNVSLIDLVVNTQKSVSVASVNDAFRKASSGSLEGYLSCSEEPLVSIDFNGTWESAIIDTALTKSIEDKLVKVLAWYDNETGFSHRMLDLAVLVGKHL